MIYKGFLSIFCKILTKYSPNNDVPRINIPEKNRIETKIAVVPGTT